MNLESSQHSLFCHSCYTGFVFFVRAVYHLISLPADQNTLISRIVQSTKLWANVPCFRLATDKWLWHGNENDEIVRKLLWFCRDMFLWWQTGDGIFPPLFAMRFSSSGPEEPIFYCAANITKSHFG